MKDTPIIFIIGLSGVGKSVIAEYIKNKYNFLYIDIDQHFGFSQNKLQSEWHIFENSLEAIVLATTIRSRVTVAGLNGAVVAFPSNREFSLEMIRSGLKLGIQTILLWSSYEESISSRKERDQSQRKEFNKQRYNKSNYHVYTRYESIEFNDVRINVFNKQGDRWTQDEICEKVFNA